METMETKKQEADVGNTLKIMLPSQFSVTIREQNGEDDDILSKVSDCEDTTALHNFISGIIIKNDQLSSDKYTTSNDIKKWRLKDKYYLALKSRIFSLGPELHFEHACERDGCGKTTPYDEDLSKYDWDLTKPLPKEGSEEYDKFMESHDLKYMITPYPRDTETHRILTLSSGKIIRYKYLDGIGEKSTLEVDKSSISKNLELTARSIELKLDGEAKVEGKWQKLTNFKLFTAREMRQIRIDVKKHDSQFDIRSEVKCSKCGNIVILPLISFTNFFFPEDS